MKRLLAFVLILCMVMSMSAVAFASEAEKVLTIGWPSDAGTLDPARAASDFEYRVLIATNEPLLRDVEGEAQPGSAESYEVNDDQTEYVFHLRENNAYYDGTPITAADFEYAIKRLLNPDEAYDQASTGFIIANAENYYYGEADEADLGIEVVDRESYSVGDTDYSAQIAKMLSANPDIICICVIGEVGGPLVRQLRLGGYNGIILDKESFMDSQIEIAGAENSNYIAFANPYVTYKSVEDCDIPNMKEYLQLYLDTYGEMVATDSAYRGWDSMMVLAEAAKIAGSNESDALREATHQVVIEGLGGTLDYTSGNREGYNTFPSFILVDGKNVKFSTWMENGGYDAYLEATGNDK